MKNRIKLKLKTVKVIVNWLVFYLCARVLVKRWSHELCSSL